MPRSVLAYVIASLLCATTITLPDLGRAEGTADTPDRYRQAEALFHLGLRAAQRSDWPAAISALQRSVELVDRPSSYFNLVLCHIEQQNWVAAHRTLSRYLQLFGPELSKDEEAESKQLLRDVALKTAQVELQITPPTAAVTLDGSTPPSGFPWVVTPGQHTVAATAPGYLHFQRKLMLTAAQHLHLKVQLQLQEPTTLSSSPSAHSSPPAEETSSWWQRPLLWAAAGGVGTCQRK